MPAYSWFLALGSISFWFTVLVRRKRNRLLLLFFHLIPYGHGLVSQGREPFSSWRYPFQLLAHQLGKNQKTNLKMCWKIYWDYHVWTLLPGLRFIYCLIITSDLCLEHFSSKKKKSRRISVNCPYTLSLGRMPWSLPENWTISSAHLDTYLESHPKLRLLLFQEIKAFAIPGYFKSHRNQTAHFSIVSCNGTFADQWLKSLS